MTQPIALPSKSVHYHERMTLVLDLDETLVHCSIEHLEKSELTFPVSHGGQDYEVNVRRRPFFREVFTLLKEPSCLKDFSVLRHCERVV